SHASTLKSPSYTKSVSWQHYPQNGSVPGKTYSSKALMSGNVKNAQIASVKVQYLDKQKKMAVMNIEYN
ncbi:hypothetical protein ACSSLP_11410, partial [Escherichia coli]